MNDAPLEITATKRQKRAALPLAAILLLTMLILCALAIVMPPEHGRPPLNIGKAILIFSTLEMFLLMVALLLVRQVSRFRIRVSDGGIEETTTFRTRTVSFADVAAFQRVLGSPETPFCFLHLYDANEKLLYRPMLSHSELNKAEAEAQHRFWAQVALRLQERGINEWVGTLGVGLLPTPAETRAANVQVISFFLFLFVEGMILFCCKDGVINAMSDFILRFGVPALGEWTAGSTVSLFILIVAGALFLVPPFYLGKGATVLYNRYWNRDCEPKDAHRPPSHLR